MPAKEPAVETGGMPGPGQECSCEAVGVGVQEGPQGCWPTGMQALVAFPPTLKRADMCDPTRYCGHDVCDF